MEQAVEKELSWFRDTSLALEELRVINLDPDIIASHLNEQKVSFSTFTKIFSVYIYIYTVVNVVKFFKINHMMYVVLQILAVEILQHKFNIEKMVKILELLQTYTEEGETQRLQVR